MSVFFQQLKWQFMLLHRNNLINISVIMTLMYALIFFMLKDLGNIDKILTLLIYNDPAVIGLFFIGLSIIIDKKQQVLPALFVTPVNLHVFLITRILSLSIVGWLCGLGMGFTALGLSFHIGHFSVGVFGTCVLFSLLGLYIVSYTSDFLMFMLKAIVPMLVLALPAFNYFGVTDVSAFYWLPTQGCLNLLIYSFNGSENTAEIVYGYLSFAFWIPVLYALVFFTFKKKIVNA